MRQLLILALYILGAIGLGYLTWWGANQVGLPSVPSMIVAGIVFVLVLIFGFNKTGVSDV
jgi:quinol-cytochrome oxidoreductase complex cytochrome b subunit